MDKLYQEVTDYLVVAGKRLAAKAGTIEDIGIAKQFLTEEDLRIERDLKEIVGRAPYGHAVYSEEENDSFPDNQHIWAIDPISSTKNYIQGKPHYAIVATHLHNGVARSAVAYDPAVHELFTARAGQGTCINGQPVRCPEHVDQPLILRISGQWQDEAIADTVKALLGGKDIIINSHSLVVNYMDIARGRASGLISLAKDSFPNFAGTLLLNEAGGIATNIEGDTIIKPTDRIFIAGTKASYPKLFSSISQTIK